MSLYTILADDFRPPALSGTHSVKQASFTGAASEASLALDKGMYYVTFQALSADAYVAFKLASSVAAVTTTTGWKIPSGEERSWVISSDVYAYIEIIGSGAGTLKWYISSTKRNLTFR
jgi:hypothetical protein